MGEYVQLEFSADGERLIALGNGVVEIYDLATRTLIDVFEIEEAIESSPISGRRAASLGQGGVEAVVATATGDVVVYSVEDGSAVATIRPDGVTVTEVALAPNEGRIAVGHEDGTVSIWDREGDGPRVRFEANGNRVTGIAFNADGALLATASSDPIFGEEVVLPEPARMWNPATGAQVGADLPLTPEDRRGDIESGASLKFSADGETLISAGPRTLRRWSVPSGELLSSANTPIPGRENPAFVGGIATLPGGRVALEADGFLVVVDGPRLEPASAFVFSQVVPFGGTIAANADGSLVALGGTQGIFVWSPTGQQLLAEALPTGLPGVLEVIPLDENRLRSSPGPLDPLSPVVWDTREPSPQPVPFGGRNYIPDVADLDGQGQDRVIGMTFFKPPEDIRVEVWDRQTLTETGVSLEFPAPIIAVNLERGWLIGALPNELYVFDSDTGEIIEQREGFVTFDSDSYFNADGTRLITGDPAQVSATLWDTETWQAVMEFRPSDGNGILGARFAPSGELLTSGPDGTIAVRDPETFEPIGPSLIGHRGGSRMGFSTEGTRLLSWSGEESILWDFATRTRIGDVFPWMWPGPDSSDRGVSVSDDGENILIWNLNTDEWYDIACRAAGRNMTRAEIGPRDTEYQATCPQFPLEP